MRETKRVARTVRGQRERVVDNERTERIRVFVMAEGGNNREVTSAATGEKRLRLKWRC